MNTHFMPSQIPFRNLLHLPYENIDQKKDKTQNAFKIIDSNHFDQVKKFNSMNSAISCLKFDFFSISAILPYYFLWCKMVKEKFLIFLRKLPQQTDVTKFIGHYQSARKLSYML